MARCQEAQDVCVGISRDNNVKHLPCPKADLPSHCVPMKVPITLPRPLRCSVCCLGMGQLVPATVLGFWHVFPGGVSLGANSAHPTVPGEGTQGSFSSMSLPEQLFKDSGCSLARGLHSQLFPSRLPAPQMSKV